MTEESSNDRWQIGAWRTKYEALLQEHLAIKRSMKEAATASPIKADELRDIEARALAVPHDVTVTTSTDPAEHGVAVARFVAYARTDVPRLLSEIHRLNAEVARLRGDRGALQHALRWYVDNDDTNEGGRWEESNAGWLEGKRRAQALLEEP